MVLKGTVRSLIEEVRDLAEKRVGEIASRTAEAFGAEAMTEYERGYPVMVNSEEETGFAAKVAERITGQATKENPPVMGAEDFSYMLEARPGSYILVGNGDTAPVHNPNYDFNDEIIPVGSSYWAELVEIRMPAA